MCLACQMENELWYAYLDELAQREKAEGAPAAKPSPKADAAPAFVCEEPPSE